MSQDLRSTEKTYYYDMMISRLLAIKPLKPSRAFPADVRADMLRSYEISFDEA